MTALKLSHYPVDRRVDIGITISRDGKSKTYTGFGQNRNRATEDAVRKMLDDSTNAEMLP